MTTEPSPPPIALIERAIDPRLVLFHAPASREAEQFRGLRNSIVAMNPERAPRTVALAASVTGEGLTVSCANLALAIAELAGTRVLLVDANLRNPGLENLLALPHKPGLADVLFERVSLDRAIRPTLSKNVDILTAGKLPENPAELLAKGRLKPVLDTLKPDYSYILVDTPPVSEFTDANLVARDCDGTVVIVRLELTPRFTVEQSVQQLRSLGANLLGAFVVASLPSGRLQPIDAPAR